MQKKVPHKHVSQRVLRPNKVHHKIMCSAKCTSREKSATSVSSSSPKILHKHLSQRVLRNNNKKSPTSKLTKGYFATTSPPQTSQILRKGYYTSQKVLHKRAPLGGACKRTGFPPGWFFITTRSDKMVTKSLGRSRDNCRKHIALRFVCFIA